jgi:hypothetical protein
MEKNTDSYIADYSSEGQGFGFLDPWERACLGEYIRLYRAKDGYSAGQQHQCRSICNVLACME